MMRWRSVLGLSVLAIGLMLASAGTADAHKYRGYGYGYSFRPGVSVGISVGGIGFGYGSYYRPYYPSYYYRSSYGPYGLYDPIYDPIYVPRTVYVPTVNYRVIRDDPSYSLPRDIAPRSGFARIQMLFNDPDAQVWVEGHKTTTTGKSRMFESPELPGGKSFTYRVKATLLRDGKEVSEERAVEVAAGQTTVVDFTKPPIERVPPPGGGRDLPPE